MSSFLASQAALVSSHAAGAARPSGSRRVARKAVPAEEGVAAAALALVEEDEDPEEQAPGMELPLPVDDDGAALPVQPGVCALEVPGDLASHLRPFQREGVKFIHNRWCLYTGCVLADDMGLGKTIQTIAFLAAILRKRGKRFDAPPEARTPHRILIVVPKTLLKNWANELDRWGSFAHVTAHGSAQRLQSGLHAVESGAAEILLTTSTTYAMHATDFNAITWAVVVWDEAHTCLQNPKTQTYQAMSEAPACAFKLFLTGTPGTNHLKQIHAMFSLVSAGCLGPAAHFDTHYAHVIHQGRAVGADKQAIALGSSRAQELSKLLQRYMLLRKKSDPDIQEQLRAVDLALPKKREMVVFCELAPLQMRAYRRMLDSEDFNLLSRYHEPCQCHSGLMRGRCCFTECDGPWFRAQDHSLCNERCPTCMVFLCMHWVQDVANHLELIKANPKEADPVLKRRQFQVATATLGDDVHDAGGVWRTDSWEHLADISQCGKLRALDALLRKWRDAYSEGNKVLIFSKRVHLLHILENYLQARDYSFVRIDGDTPTADRSRLVDEFNTNTGVFIFLLSVQAGGTGLNLTSANRVVIFDPNWNPADDAQAQDRAFRIGQLRDVTVYRLVGANTVEELMYMRQVDKSQATAAATRGVESSRLFKGVRDRNDQRGELWGLENLFKPLPQDESVRMKTIRERALKVETAFVCKTYKSDEDEDEDSIHASDSEDGGGHADAAPRARRGGAACGAGPCSDMEEDEAALRGAGAVYTYDHGAVMDRAGNASETIARAAAIELTATMAVGARHTARREEVTAVQARKQHRAAAPTDGVGRAVRIGGAPHGVGSMFGVLAKHLGMSDAQCAQHLLSVDGIERSNIIETFLMQKGRRRTLL